MRKFLTISLLALTLSVGAAAVPVSHSAHVLIAHATPAQNLTMDSGKIADSYASVMQYIMMLFAWLVGLASITLDNVVYYTVVHMGDLIGGPTGSGLSAIGVTWRILRDIGNIVLIFGFLAIGITTILNVNWYGGGTKMLPKLLLAAVFLNFSLFFTEAIIDTGNLFATQFYTQINGGAPAVPVNYSVAAIHNEGISNKIMSQLGLQTIYGGAQTNQAVFKSGNSWIIGFMGVLLFLTTAFVMFSLTFILIARFVALVFLIVIAPIGFAGWAVPKLSNTASKWWSALFDQTITAPVLLLLLYVALAVITDRNFLTGFGVNNGGGYLGFVNNTALGNFASMMLSFFVAMGLLIAVTVVAKRMSAFGSTWATRLAGSASFGVAAWGANRTIGRGAYFLGRRARQSQAFNRVDALTGQAMSRTLDRAATATYDIRSTGALKNLPLGGVDAGKAAKGGFQGARDRTIKRLEGEAKKIETAHKEAFTNETGAETRAINAAEEANERARSAKEAAEKRHDTEKERRDEAQRAVDTHNRRVRELEERDRAHRSAGTTLTDEGRAASDALREARQRQGQLAGNLQTAANSFREAEGAFSAAKREEAQAKKGLAAAVKVPGDRRKEMEKSVKENKQAFGSAIGSRLNIVGYGAYGPGSGAAGDNIISSTRDKGDEKKFLDLAKKLSKGAEGGEGEEEKPAEAAGGETTPPPAPPTPPAPGS